MDFASAVKRLEFRPSGSNNKANAEIAGGWAKRDNRASATDID
jgi:hypothetical protein